MQSDQTTTLSDLGLPKTNLQDGKSWAASLRAASRGARLRNEKQTARLAE